MLGTVSSQQSLSDELEGTQILCNVSKYEYIHFRFTKLSITPVIEMFQVLLKEENPLKDINKKKLRFYEFDEVEIRFGPDGVQGKLDGKADFFTGWIDRYDLTVRSSNPGVGHCKIVELEDLEDEIERIKRKRKI